MTDFREKVALLAAQQRTTSHSLNTTLLKMDEAIPGFELHPADSAYPAVASKAHLHDI